MKIKGFKDTIAWYEQNAEKYIKATKNRSRTDQLGEFVKHLPKKSYVLDAGCAGGRDTNNLFRRGLHVVGLDIGKNFIKRAKEQFPKLNFVVGDMRSLPFSDSLFDGIWAHASLVHFETTSDVERALLEFYRVLKKSGIIHLYVKEKIGVNKTAIVSDSLSKHKKFFQYFTKKEIELLLKKTGFSIIKSETFNEAQRYKSERKDVRWVLVLARKI